MIELDPRALRVNKDFAPKLTRDDRRAILALSYRGVSHAVIAMAFNVDRRTISSMASPSSVHYSGLRKEVEHMGVEDFIRAYLNDDHIKRVNDVIHDPEAMSSLRRASQIGNAVTRAYPNPRATRMAGDHTITHEWYGGPLNFRIELQIVASAIEVPGVVSVGAKIKTWGYLVPGALSVASREYFNYINVIDPNKPSTLPENQTLFFTSTDVYDFLVAGRSDVI